MPPRDTHQWAISDHERAPTDAIVLVSNDAIICQLLSQQGVMLILLGPLVLVLTVANSVFMLKAAAQEG
ncbi:unnamed protein product [Urochloa humidicola]